MAQRRTVREAGPPRDLAQPDAVEPLVEISRAVRRAVPGAVGGDAPVVGLLAAVAFNGDSCRRQATVSTNRVDTVNHSPRSAASSNVRRWTEYPHLLSPGRIGSLALRNRILMAPMGDSLANPDGSISDAQLAYFEARARGGAALLLVGSVAVAYPDGCVDARQVAASDDRYLAGLARARRSRPPHGAARRRPAHLQRRARALRHRPRSSDARPGIPKRSRPDRLSMMVTDAEIAGFMAPHASPTAKVEYQVATDDDLARGHRSVRRRDRPVPARRYRRRRAPRGPRLSHRRVPQPRRSTVGTTDGAVRSSTAPGCCWRSSARFVPGSATTTRSGCASTRSNTTRRTARRSTINSR